MLHGVLCQSFKKIDYYFYLNTQSRHIFIKISLMLIQVGTRNLLTKAENYICRYTFSLLDVIVSDMC